ncbi:MAG: sigma-70 family RNA polymerase sigma factor [Acidobacteriaceae bacterium]|nr:sigma-70 family RNA polymerase sigma factor [Acidobacteriaceae bacterium]
MSTTPTTSERVSVLYEAHRLAIYRFLVGQGLDPRTAQDVTQDVFVKLFTAVDRGMMIQSEQAWLYSVASKSAVDYWRREGRSMWVELDAAPAILESLRSPELTPEANAARSERLRRVAKAMASLPKEQRLGIHLRMQGMRYRAIAEILGVSISTTAEWLSIAVERLRGVANE